jgi:hypothetical protein
MGAGKRGFVIICSDGVYTPFYGLYLPSNYEYDLCFKTPRSILLGWHDERREEGRWRFDAEDDDSFQFFDLDNKIILYCGELRPDSVEGVEYWAFMGPQINLSWPGFKICNLDLLDQCFPYERPIKSTASWIKQEVEALLNWDKGEREYLPLRCAPESPVFHNNLVDYVPENFLGGDPVYALVFRSSSLGQCSIIEEFLVDTMLNIGALILPFAKSPINILLSTTVEDIRQKGYMPHVCTLILIDDVQKELRVSSLHPVIHPRYFGAQWEGWTINCDSFRSLAERVGLAGDLIYSEEVLELAIDEYLKRAKLEEDYLKDIGKSLDEVRVELLKGAYNTVWF